ncbi:MAG: ABC transporter ATP-binding protein [Acidobacteria bacterium]|nr:ABC transporter ATP-binding protein [Acidobacteriota bacterium]
MTGEPPLLSVRGLTVAFPLASGLAAAVSDVSFDLAPGEVAALVGESGSGKSLTALALLALLPEHARVSGKVLFSGRDVLSMPEAELCRLRGGSIGLVFQEPGAALDPVRKIGPEIVAVIRRHRGMSRRQGRAEALGVLGRVALPGPEARFNDYPHQMSGGMRQRAMIALALAGGPRLLIADEPTTALDTTIQAQILALLRSLAAELGLAILLITHDLGVVKDVASRALVMYAGRIVESAPVEDLLSAPRHPYTKALLRCLPGRDPASARKSRLPVLPGMVPVPGEWPPGCSFAPRCPLAVPECSARIPAPDEWQQVVTQGACHRQGTCYRQAACFRVEANS